MFQKIKHILLADKYVFFTALLIAFHTVLNLIWIILNNVPPVYDAAFHTVLSMRMADYLKTSLFSFNIHEFLTISKYYPPFTHMVGSLMALVGNFNIKAIQFTGTLFFAATLGFMYLFVKNRFGSKMAFWSVFFYSFFFIIFKESRDLMTDIPLTGALMAGLFFLDKSAHLSQRKNSLLFFISLAIGILIKWTAGIFFFIPLLIELYHIAKRRETFSAVFQNMVTGILLVAVICVPWYLTNRETIAAIGSVSITPELDDPTRLFSLDTVLFYPKVLIIFILSFVGFIFLLISLFIMKLDKDFKKWLFPLAMILFTYVMFTFIIGNKNIRYIMPVVPFLAMMIGYGWTQILDKSRYALGLIYSPFLLIFALISYFILSFGVPIYPQYKHALQFPVLGWTDIYYWHQDPVKGIYDSIDWHNREIAKILIAESAQDADTLFYFIDAELPYLNASTVHAVMYETYKGVPRSMQELDTNFPFVLQGRKTFANDQELEQYINKADIIIIPKKQIGNRTGLRDFDVRAQIQQFFLSKHATQFAVLKEISLPDKDTIVIYKKTGSALNPYTEYKTYTQ